MTERDPHDPDPPVPDAASQAVHPEPAARQSDALEAEAPPVEPESMSAGEAVRGLFGSRPMLFPNAYAWLLLLSALDIMFTWMILTRGGREVNAIADWVIRRFDLEGMITYKFVLVLVFVLLCEVVGRLRLSSGKMLSTVGVCIASIPVIWSTYLLFGQLVFLA